jgi:hypothetical protein
MRAQRLGDGRETAATISRLVHCGYGEDERMVDVNAAAPGE